MPRFLRRVLHGFEFARDMDYRFRRNAAADETCAPQPVGFDERCVQAELARADGRDVTTRSAADHKHFGFDRFSHKRGAPLQIKLSWPANANAGHDKEDVCAYQTIKSVAGCSRSDLSFWMNSAAS